MYGTIRNNIVNNGNNQKSIRKYVNANIEVELFHVVI